MHYHSVYKLEIVSHEADVEQVTSKKMSCEMLSVDGFWDVSVASS